MSAIAVEPRHPDDLTAAECAAWERFRAADDRLRSPYFHIEFTRTVAAVRRDVQVAVLRRGEECVGFLPYQHRGRRGLPVGGRLNDYHGLVAEPGLEVDLGDVVTTLGLRRFDFHHVVPEQRAFAGGIESHEPAPYLDLRDGFDAYAEQRRAAGSKRIKRVSKKARQLERDFGPVRCEVGVEDPAVLEQLLSWKSEQYRRTGMEDVFRHRWTVELLERLHALRDDDFRGLLSTLHAGDELVAIEFGMRSGQVVHSWFPAYDEEFSRYSAGSLLLLRMAERAAELGVTRVDLGPGEEFGKGSFASGCLDLARGVVVPDPISRFLREAHRRTRDVVDATPLAHAKRLVRPLREWMEFR